jgi:carbonic anhydrase/acetyltransferase-like protein (isoleucine patch superfamily)
MLDPSALIAGGVVVVGHVELGLNASSWSNAVLRGDSE